MAKKYKAECLSIDCTARVEGAKLHTSFVVVRDSEGNIRQLTFQGRYNKYIGAAMEKGKWYQVTKSLFDISIKEIKEVWL